MDRGKKIMGKNIFEKQLEDINKAWDEVGNFMSPQLEEKLRIAHDMILSFLYPKKFNPERRVLFNKWADKNNFKPTNFKAWWEKQKEVASGK